jgi:hypothetical protein
MCIFHASSPQQSFKEFLEQHPELPVYQHYEKGDILKISVDKTPTDDYGFSCEVSDRDWQDVDGQVVDMISFLEVYAPQLRYIKENYTLDDWHFDLPYECQLNGECFVQTDFLPAKLLRLAGDLEIGIELSLYWPAAEDTDEVEVSQEELGEAMGDRVEEE